MLSYTHAPYASRLTFHIFGMAERVGFEPTVPLLGRMLSKHVDSTTLAPLHTTFSRGGILTWGPVTSKLTFGVHHGSVKVAYGDIEHGRVPL
jgi:hypothetical protein